MTMPSDKIGLTAAQILAVSVNAPEKLFSGDSEHARSEYHALSRRWHPDHNSQPEAVAVFQHLTELYRKAQELIKVGAWRGAGVLELAKGSGANSVTRHINYLKRTNFELGEMYLGGREVVFFVERRYADLFENARRQIAKMRFANDAMRKEIERFLPHEAEYYATATHLIMVLPKTADAVLLEDLLEYLGGEIDVQHVGWIASSLYNLACYLEFTNLVHHDIGCRTVWVSPEFHSATLLGGWWYAGATGEKIAALPNRTLKIAPPDVLRKKLADGRVDLELIRQTGRELLGDASGMRLRTNGKIPAAMARWFNGATSGSAVTDYQLWKNVLEMDFGKPRFIKFDVEPSAIYGR